VVGVLVEAEIGHDHGCVAEVAGQVPQRLLHDAGRVVGGGAAAVLDGRDAEEHDPADARLRRLVRGLTQRVPGVLDDAGHRRDRLRLGYALLDEQREDELGRVQPGLRDHAPQRRRTPQPTRPSHRKLCAHQKTPLLLLP
jgi:hypothetical protein